MFNQVEIDSVDQYDCRNQRQILLTQIKNFCVINDIEFTSKLTPGLIANSTKEKIVFMWMFDLVGDYYHWQKLNDVCRQCGKVLLVITDNIINFNDLEFVKIFSYPELLGVHANPVYSAQVNDFTPKKLYNCFIQRVDSTRQSWFYFLYHHDLLNKGHVSFLLKQLESYSTLTGKDLFDFIHDKYSLHQLPHFELAYQKLKNQVPYRNFNEDHNLLPLILDSKYSLILETYATDDNRNQWCLNEKLLRSLQFPTFNLPFIQKGGIRVLQSLGFKFNLNLDHIDMLTWQERQQKLLQILIDDTIDYDKNMLYNISKHNQELLQSWKTQYQKSDFFDNFYNKAIQI